MVSPPFAPLAVSVVFFSFSACCSPVRGDQTLDELAKIWNSMTDEVMTADIEYVAVTRPVSNACSESQFRELWEKVDVTDLISVSKFAESLDPKLLEDSPAFTTKRFVLRPDAIRTDSTHGGNVGTMLRVDNTELRHLSINSEIRVSGIGVLGLSMEQIGNLRYLPKRKSWDGYLVERIDSQNCKLIKENGDGNNETLIVDSSTGFVFQLFTRTRDATKLVIQRGPLESSTDIIFPKARLDGSFKNGALQLFQLRVFTKVVFNKAVSESEFCLKVPPNTKIFDYRQNKNKPNFQLVIDGAADALKLVNDAEKVRSLADNSEARIPISPRIRTQNRIVIIVLSIITLVLMFLLFRIKGRSRI